MTTHRNARISETVSVSFVLALVAATLTFTLAPAAAHAQFMQYAFIPGDDNSTVARVTVPDMTEGTSFGSGANPRSVAVSPDGRRVYIANYGFGSNNVTVNDALTGAFIQSLSPPSTPYALAITPDGRWLYVTLQSAAGVAVFDLDTHTYVTTISVGGGPTTITINPAGTLAYVGNESSESVTVVDLSTRTAIATVPVGGAPGGIAILPDATRAYVPLSYGTESQVVKVVDLATNLVRWARRRSS